MRVRHQRRRTSFRARARLLTAATLVAFVAQLLPIVAAPVAAATVIEPGFQLTTLFSGLNQPTSIGFGGDGRIFVAERDGLIKAWDGPTDTSATTVVDLRTQVHAVADRGLLGMAVDPQFPTRPYVYALYIVDAQPGGTAPYYNDSCPLSPSGAKDGCPATGRLSRIQVGSDSRIVGSEFPLLAGDFWCHQQQAHAVDNLEFGRMGPSTRARARERRPASPTGGSTAARPTRSSSRTPVVIRHPLLARP